MPLHGSFAVCTGQKSAPLYLIIIGTVLCADLAVAPDDVFVGTQLGQAHGAAGVQLLGGDAHFAPQAELAPVGETGGAVDVDRRAVHRRGEQVNVAGRLAEDGVAVAGGVGGDVGHRVLYAVHDAHRQDVVQKFGVEVLGAGGGAGDDGRGTRVQPQLHRVEAAGRAVGAEALGQLGQELRRNVLVDQADLLGVADAGAAGLGVLDDVEGLGLVGGVVHVDVADAGAGLDAGHLGILDAGADQAGPAPGDQQVHVTHRLHQGVGGGAGGVLDQVDGGCGQAGGRHPLAQGVHNGFAGAPGFLAAAQHAGIAALEGQGRRVAGDVGAALVDDGDDPHRDGGLFDDEAVGPLDAAQHRPHRVGQGGHFPDALGHTVQPFAVQGKAVQHHLRDVAAGGVQVGGVGAEDGRAVGGVIQSVRHAQQGAVALGGAGNANGALGIAGGGQDLLCGHGAASFQWARGRAANRVPAASPSAILYSSSGWAPLAMTISTPSAVTIWAARSLVAMPPVPRAEPAPSDIPRISGVISSTRGISLASGWVRGLAVYSPSMSLSRTSRSARAQQATMAARVSLSPMEAISMVDTVSFSLMMGSAPSSSRR